MKKKTSPALPFPPDLAPFQVPAHASPFVQTFYGSHTPITPTMMVAGLHAVFAQHLHAGVMLHQRFNCPLPESPDVVLVEVTEVFPTIDALLADPSRTKRRPPSGTETYSMAHPRDVFKLCTRWVQQQLVELTQTPYHGGYDLAAGWQSAQACNYLPGQQAWEMLPGDWRTILQVPDTANPFFMIQIIEWAQEAGYRREQAAGQSPLRWLSQKKLADLHTDVVTVFDFNWWRSAITHRDVGEEWGDPLGVFYERWISNWPTPRLEL